MYAPSPKAGFVGPISDIDPSFAVSQGYNQPRPSSSSKPLADPRPLAAHSLRPSRSFSSLSDAQEAIADPAFSLFLSHTSADDSIATRGTLVPWQASSNFRRHQTPSMREPAPQAAAVGNHSPRQILVIPPQQRHLSTDSLDNWPKAPVSITMKNMGPHLVEYGYREDGEVKHGRVHAWFINPPTTFTANVPYSFKLRCVRRVLPMSRYFERDEDWDLAVYFQ